MKALDRFGNEFKQGDTVEIVHGGELHQVKVDKLEEERAAPDAPARLYAHVTLAVRVLADAVRHIPRKERTTETEETTPVENPRDAGEAEAGHSAPLRSGTPIQPPPDDTRSPAERRAADQAASPEPQVKRMSDAARKHTDPSTDPITLKTDKKGSR